MATKSIVVPMNQTQSQSSFRAYGTFYDQHRHQRFPLGRPWGGQTERQASGSPIGLPVQELTPDGWTAPWLPHGKYLSRNIGRNPKAGQHFQIDYDLAIVEFSEGGQSYYIAAAQLAAKLGLKGQDVPKLYGPVAFQITATMGPPPPSPKVYQAAKTGHPWILGFEQEPDELLQRIMAEHDRYLKMVPEEYDWSAQAVEARAEQALGMTASQLEAIIERRVQEAMDRVAQRQAGMGSSVSRETSRPVVIETSPAVVASLVETARAVPVAPPKQPAPASPVGAAAHRAFMSDAMKSGLSMEQASEAWQLHKAGLSQEATAGAA